MPTFILHFTSSSFPFLFHLLLVIDVDVVDEAHLVFLSPQHKEEHDMMSNGMHTPYRPRKRTRQFPLTTAEAESPTQITRETFISFTYVRNAIEFGYMFIPNSQGELIKTPVPQYVRETGILPDGYGVEFLMDPYTMVVAFAERNVTDIRQLSVQNIENIRLKVCSPHNVRIVPKRLADQKLRILVAMIDENSEAARRMLHDADTNMVM